MQTIFIVLSIVFAVTIVLNIVLIIRSPGLKRNYESRLNYQQDIIHTLQRQLNFYLREWCRTRADKTGESESKGKIRVSLKSRAFHGRGGRKQMTKEQVINVEEYPMQDENGNSIFVVGGYKFTVPQEVNNTLLEKYRKYDEDFPAVERLLRLFVNRRPYIGQLLAIHLVSEIISEAF